MDLGTRSDVPGFFFFFICILALQVESMHLYFILFFYIFFLWRHFLELRLELQNSPVADDTSVILWYKTCYWTTTRCWKLFCNWICVFWPRLNPKIRHEDTNLMFIFTLLYEKYQMYKLDAHAYESMTGMRNVSVI